MPSKKFKDHSSLRESEVRYKSLFEKFPGMIWRSDTGGAINYVNQSLLKFTGSTFEEVMGRGWLKDVHPDDRDAVEKIQYEHIAKRRPFEMEYRLRHRSGEYRWIIDAGKPYEDIDGNFAGYIGTCFDINRRKMVEERMDHINRLYSVISRVNQAIVKIKERAVLLHEVCKISVEQGKFTMAWVGIHVPEKNSIQVAAQYGKDDGYLESVSFRLSTNTEDYSPAQIAAITGKPYIANVVETDPRMVRHREEALRRGFRSAAAFPIRFTDVITGVFVVYSGEENYFTVQEKQLLEDIAGDISYAVPKIADELKRVETERSLYASEERFRTLVQSMDDIVYVLDRNQRHIGVYGKWLEASGLSEDMFLGKTAGDIFTPESAKVHEDANKRALNGEHVLYTWIAEMPDGNRYMQTSLSPVGNARGEITGIVGVGRDVTELREVQEIQRLQSAALESAANAVVITDIEGTIQTVNKAFTELTGYEKDEVVGKKTKILKSGKHDESFYKNLWETIRSGQVWVGEVVNKRKDGTLYTEEMTITPVRDSLGIITNFIAIKQDVTKQKELQHHLVQAQKMESVGKLASGIAHDFNNILGIIIGYSSLIERNAGDKAKFIQGIQAINKAVQRGANLVQQILTFARKTDVAPDIVRVNTVVTELTKMLEETFPKTITIELALGKHMPALVIDQSQLHQALLNLCVNARDAILASGRPSGAITVKTSVIPGSRLQTRYPDAGPEKYISISVADTGTGMDDVIVEKIFEPFFTTKERGKGTGLGLSVVYGIVQSYQGYIDVDSEPGAGTNFTLYIPVRPVSEELAEQSITDDEEIPGGSETIFIIEDEPLLLDALQNILEEKGYTVITAKDGKTAVDIYSQHQYDIDIILSDVGLPKMNGTEIYRQIKDINRDVLFIMASGYFDPVMKKEMADDGVNAFIRKPYQPDEILLTIRSVLGG